MSGIAGIINFDGAPVDQELLGRMTGMMKNRGPDELSVWSDRNIGFGHAMLRISPESVQEHQPCSIDGTVWVVADVRIDGRAELIRSIRAASHQVPDDAPDVELILRAYAALGESFLDHLLGDFAFALWDGRTQQLICARDHFGTRPFFYAHTKRSFIFASDLDALLLHPQVKSDLDDIAVGDFLMLGHFRQDDLSIYRDIRRLRPASRVRLDRSGCDIRRYWEVPCDQEIRYRNNSDYVEHFNVLFTQAVHDRLRASDVAIELSGGLDSTSVAAVAAPNVQSMEGRLTSYTITCNRLLPGDQEGHFATIVASHLGIPNVRWAVEDYPLIEPIEPAALRSAEPASGFDMLAIHRNLREMAASGARVLLSGQGGDAAMAGSSTYTAHLFRTGQWLRLIRDVSAHAFSTGSLAGSGLRHALRPRPPAADWHAGPLPDWFNPDFVKRTELKERWASLWHGDVLMSDAYHQLRRPWFGCQTAAYGEMRAPIEARHPFHDLRLVTYLLALPNFVTAKKRILRDAMMGKLPEAVLSRPKAPLAGDLTRVRFKEGHLDKPRPSNVPLADDGYIVRDSYLSAFDRYLQQDSYESTWPSVYLSSPLNFARWNFDRAKKS